MADLHPCQVEEMEEMEEEEEEEEVVADHLDLRRHRRLEELVAWLQGRSVGLGFDKIDWILEYFNDQMDLMATLAVGACGRESSRVGWLASVLRRRIHSTLPRRCGHLSTGTPFLHS